MFKLFANEREDSSPVTLQGYGIQPPHAGLVQGDLHNDLNVQSCYWPAYKTGNVNLVRPYTRLLFCGFPQRFVGENLEIIRHPGCDPHPTMMAQTESGAPSPDGASGNTILGPELFVSVDFTWFYEYSRGKGYAEGIKIYPFVERGCCICIKDCFRKRGRLSAYTPFTTSPEEWIRTGHMFPTSTTFTLVLSALSSVPEDGGLCTGSGLDGSGWKAFWRQAGAGEDE